MSGGPAAVAHRSSLTIIETEVEAYLKGPQRAEGQDEL